ncbi:MAG TPA: rod shape-determining protein RodA [Gemmatimonadaceae bacterium]|nr:rod shape-determining protein RodA [Gemmatimonadaceae bacterium]
MKDRRFVTDIPLFAVAILLTAFGIAMVYSAGETDAPTVAVGLYKRQLIWFGVALVAAYAVSRSSIRFVEWMTTPLYVATLAMLGLTLILGTGAGTAAGMKGWLTIGGIRIGQPAELAKIAVVLMLARVLAARRGTPKSLLDLWKPGLVVAIPWVMVMAQPDLGTAIVFIGIFFTMLYWAGVSAPMLLLVASPAVSLLLTPSTGLWGAWFLLLIALVLWYKPYLFEGIILITANIFTGVAAPILWERLAPYQRNRLLVFLDPSVDPRASGWHVIQSQVAIGSGGWFGKGYLMGTQKRLAFLPAQHTDFIFSVLGEELGFIGVSIALGLFAYLFLRVVRIASGANDAFSSMVAFGLLGSWLVHVIVNIGMTLNLMPITGIPLPFFSYGGSFLLASWIAIGLLMRISSEGRSGRSGGLSL